MSTGFCCRCSDGFLQESPFLNKKFAGTPLALAKTQKNPYVEHRPNRKTVHVFLVLRVNQPNIHSGILT